MKHRVQKGLCVGILFLAIGCGKPITNSFRVESLNGKPFSHADCTLFLQSVREVAAENKLQHGVTIVKKDPSAEDMSVISGHGSADEGLTVSVSCSPNLLRAVVRANSVDPLGVVRSRTHSRVADGLSKILGQRFAHLEWSISQS